MTINIEYNMPGTTKKVRKETVIFKVLNPSGNCGLFSKQH